MIYQKVWADAEPELNPHWWTEPPLQHEDSRLAVRTSTSSWVEWTVETPQASSEITISTLSSSPCMGPKGKPIRGDHGVCGQVPLNGTGR